MKATIYVSRFMAALMILLVMQSCDSKRDDKGRLLVKYITTTSGTLGFRPMMRSDSASVLAFKPDTFLYKGERYTGGLAEYDERQNLLIEGFIKNGLMDSIWKFRFISGGVKMEGTYKNGMDIGTWYSYYGFGKHKITKVYDNYGYMLERVEYYDNGHIKNYQNVKAPMFGDKARHYELDQHGGLLSIYVEDSIYMDKMGQETEKTGKNVFQEKKASSLDIAK